MSDLNPALTEARFCPRCRAEATIEHPRSLACPQCGYIAFYNPKPVACVIPRLPDGRLILLKRATDPGRDLWTFPGGHVDLGESVEEAARREAMEEVHIAVELEHLVGVYSRPDSQIVLIVYAGSTTDAPRPSEEAGEVAVVDPAGIPWGELAFWSTELALRDLLSAPSPSRAP